MPQRGYEDILVDSLADLVMDGGDLIASDSSGPAGAKRPSSREVFDLWGRTDPNVVYEQLVVRLLSGGIPPEEAQQLILVQQYPETLEAFVQPGSATQADALARLAEFPFRPSVYSHLDPDERVQYANQVQRDYEKSMQIGAQDYLDNVERGLDLTPKPSGGEQPPAAPVPVVPQPSPMSGGAAVTPPLPADPMAVMGG